jgi:hypothetical protein
MMDGFDIGSFVLGFVMCAGFVVLMEPRPRRGGYQPEAGPRPAAPKTGSGVRPPSEADQVCDLLRRAETR